MQTAPGHRRRFMITVDGLRHEVIVEELPTVDAPAAASPATATAWPAASPATAAVQGGTAVPPVPAVPGVPAPGVPHGGPAAQAPGAPGLDDGWVPAPMPGTVAEVRVQPGDRVRRGDVLLVLTAMKMENEIPAPAAGVVKAVSVAAGATVNSGDRLVQLAPEEV
ncbi:MAG: biotin/lipoyl-containing protein [Bacillota bacterium]